MKITCRLLSKNEWEDEIPDDFFDFEKAVQIRIEGAGMFIQQGDHAVIGRVNSDLRAIEVLDEQTYREEWEL